MSRKTQEQWMAILEKQAGSNKSVKRWCEEENVSYQSFLQWKKKCQQPAFVELVDEIVFELHVNTLKVSFTKIEDLKHLAVSLKGLC